MGVSVKPGGSDKTERGKARDLILEAAERVFGESGIKGATTREIARVAGVNETTLFRNFASKDVLLKAVIEKNLAEALESLYAPEHWSNVLDKDLRRYATAYIEFLKRHEPLLRVFIAEVNRLPAEARQIVNVTNAPLRNKLIEYFDTAKERGQMRPELDSVQVAHGFLSVMLMNVLRTGIVEMPYTNEQYIQTMIDVFVCGLQVETD